MFVIAYDNQVVLGPMRWNKYRFQNFLREEHELESNLPDSNVSDVVTVAENCKIYPIKGTENPVFNPVIEMLHGPFWEFTDTVAIFSYVVQPLPKDAIVNMLKSETATERYNREISGTKVTIQGIEVTVDTNRGSRDIFVQKYLLMSDTETVQWKFPEAWLTLTKTELGQIVSAGAAHVQAQFDWESTKVAEIESCTTHKELASVEIKPPVQTIG